MVKGGTSRILSLSNGENEVCKSSSLFLSSVFVSYLALNIVSLVVEVVSYNVHLVSHFASSLVNFI